MKSLYKKHKPSIMYILIIFLVSFIFTILQYVGVSYNLLINIEYIINFILVFIYSYISSTNTNKKGYKIGIEAWFKIIIILSIINIITLSGFSIKTLIYYLILLIISILGGIIGKNKRSK